MGVDGKPHAGEEVLATRRAGRPWEIGPRRLALVVIVVVVAVVGVIYAASNSSDDGQAVRLDDLNLTDAAAVAADGDDGLWILTDTALLHATDGQVDPARSLPVGGNRVATGPGGEMAMSAGATVVVIRPDQAGEVTTGLTVPEGMIVDDVTLADDGTLLVSYSDTNHTGGHLTAVAPDGRVNHILGSPSASSQDGIQTGTQATEPVEAIGSMTALPDGRIAFATFDDGRLHLLDSDGIHAIETTPRDPSRMLRLTGRSPDGRVLAIAWGLETHFQIQAINVDTGEADILADLEGIDEGAVDSTVVGNDLVFLADGSLWRVPEAFR
jgi:hypothetical protein